MSAASETEAHHALRISDDGLQVLLDGSLSGSDVTELARGVAAELQEKGIAEAPDADEIAALLRENADAEGRLEGVVLATGRAPVPPQDSRLEWAADFFDTSFAVDPRTGALDYRTRRGDPSVRAGQLLLTLHDAVKGVDGRDVFGTKLPVPAPQRERVRVGPNVRAEAELEGRTIHHASLDGRVRWAGGVLAVDPVFAISGNVGLESGHVRHSGAVVIAGDVEAGARIEAGGDVEVRGVVEAAVIRAGGRLTVQGGICGSAEEPIVVQGGVRAKFMLDARIEAGGDVGAVTEILHSEIRSRGAVLVPEGRIIGGQIVALGGVTVGIAGGEGLSQTQLVAGVDPAWQTEVVAREEQIKNLSRNLQRIRDTVEPLAARLDALAPPQREAVARLQTQVCAMQARLAELEAAVADFKADSQRRAAPRIQVRVKAHPDVGLQLEDKQLQLGQQREGPFRARLVRGAVLLLPGETDEA